ncbi:MAG TPA: SDR family NAD(P)-dependent oxidoreductase [Nitrospira sp.]|nr:SDR family NAD(P)-dependent oxidoreductase [Nitrospira sp.]
MNKQFSGQVALITGAASGMGLAASHAFAADGASVIMMDWDAKAVERAALSRQAVPTGHPIRDKTDKTF